MAQVFLSLGSNLGDCRNTLSVAIMVIDRKIGRVTAQSALYQAEPWGFSSDHWFYNQVIMVETNDSLWQVFSTIQEIEQNFGRDKKTVANIYADRMLDIDILAYDQKVINTWELCVPHPKMALRRFILEPLCDIAPTWVHPVLRKPVHMLLLECTDDKKVLKTVLKP
ncbi:MAG: 2-amino-4-hydroxy-6-hydroxymethyldihydropteridine diphosphokinase [Sphingobacteriia bacterium]|jgi:2-amino-4-hydroxy-6-hydroxymethyldihydropteridine diphosphokinase|nr:2-amino-4-hydroxy-6-hydroxymethyldihydropteridine diphosphokinase [Paludibacteraceae bacterium]NCA79452.1 2-amino-4-hydroxy-6-hydroxymethyldihydropteridine diphosphokinase [Sphingobacteriia bacterium]